MPRKHTSKEQQKAKADRICVCLAESGVSMTAVARYCEISIQSISNWKKTGQAEDENLYKLSELTGFRYLWLKTGEGDKRFINSDENLKDYLKQSPSLVLRAEGGSSGSLSGDRLLASLRRALAKDDVDESSLDHLADFLDCLSGFRPPAKGPAASTDSAGSRQSMEGCLLNLSKHITSIQPELRSSVGELLKTMCEKPESSTLLIQSILATAQASDNRGSC